MKCCLNGKALSSPPRGLPAQLRACSLLREKDRPTWLAGSSSSLLSEESLAFFSWDAGAGILILVVLELPSF